MALRLVDTIIPGAIRLWTRLVLRARNLPFRFSSLVPLAYGSGTTVYALERRGGRLVCKVQRRSLGRPLEGLIAFAAERRTRYQGVLSAYPTAADTFPVAHFAIVHNPLLGIPAVVTVQVFVTGRTRDLLNEVAEDELRDLLTRLPRLRGQVSRFFEHTVEAWERGSWIVDLGPENLLLVGDGEEIRLVYLDVEMLSVAQLKRSPQADAYDATVARMREVLDWLAAGG